MPASEREWTRQLAAARKSLGISRAELARLAGMSPQTVKAYELGLRRPSHHLLTTILDVLGLEVRKRDEILTGAGFASESSEVTIAPGARYPLSIAEAESHIAANPWPSYVVDDLFQVITINEVAERLWGEGPADYPEGHRRNLLTFATHPVYADRVMNWEEIVRDGIAMFKGYQLGGETLENPSVYLSRIIRDLMEGDTSYFERLIAMWDQVPAIQPKVRWSYRLVWCDPSAGEMEFRAIVSVCNEPKGLYFNDWIPNGRESWEALHRAIGGSSG